MQRGSEKGKFFFISKFRNFEVFLTAKYGIPGRYFDLGVALGVVLCNRGYVVSFCQKIERVG